MPSVLSIQRSLRRWISVRGWNDPRAVTLTMKQRIRGNDPGAYIHLDKDHASQNLRHFLNVLNRRVIGNVGRRHGRRISVVPVLEGTATKRLHYHLVMDCPLPSESGSKFETAIREAWSSTHWGDGQIHVTPADDGWVDYITKLADKPDFADAIDWTNAHLPG